MIGKPSCPIFRGTLAVNPETGDTFAWTVGSYDATTGLWSNLGIWRDTCAINTAGTACTNQTINFTEHAVVSRDEHQRSQRLRTEATTLTLAAVPGGVGLGTIPCCLPEPTTCGSAAWRWAASGGIQPMRRPASARRWPAYQHALAVESVEPAGSVSGQRQRSVALHWTRLGARSGVRRSLQADAAHFQNLNEGLGSLAEVDSMAQGGGTPYKMMAGLGVNGTAGVKSATGATADWPQILGGNGGPVAIDPINTSNWYVNNQDGVSIYACTETGGCTPSDFGTSPVIDMNGKYADGSIEDGYLMTTPAPILVDPIDPTQLLIGTCRVWRVPIVGGWSATNAISKIFDSGVTNGACDADSPIRSIAAMALAGGEEIIYAGTTGSRRADFLLTDRCGALCITQLQVAWGRGRT